MNENQLHDGLFEILKTHFKEEHYKAKTAIIREGQKSNKFYYLEEGLLRGWLNHEGREITFQFLFEGRLFCSIESFWFKRNSAYTVETIESAKLFAVDRSVIFNLLETDAGFLILFNEYIIRRFLSYQRLLIAKIKDKPEKRYRELLNSYPEIIRRVPQHYIACYLGITSVSLSRIRNRKIIN